MAIVHQCDRCGSIAQSHETISWLIIGNQVDFTDKSFRAREQRLVNMNIERNKKRKKYPNAMLCEDCAEQLYAWIGFGLAPVGVV